MKFRKESGGGYLHPLPHSSFMARFVSMAKKQNHGLPGWMGEKGERFIRFSTSQSRSAAWRDLKARTRTLYIHMLFHYKGAPLCEVAKSFPSVQELQRNDLFFYPWEEARKTGLYTDKRQFYTDDIKSLEKHGFIKILARGKYCKMTIYQYTDKWKRWEPPPKSKTR